MTLFCIFFLPITQIKVTSKLIRINFNKAFGNPPKSLLYFCQDRIKESSYF